MNAAPDAPPASALKLRFDFTTADLHALVHQIHDGSDGVRATRRKLTRNLPLLVLAIFGGLTLLTHETKYLLAGLVLAPIWAFIVPRQFDRIVLRQMQTNLERSDPRGLIGPHEMELDDTELVERFAVRQVRTPFATIDRIVTSGGRTFVCVGPLGHVIPHDAVTEGDRKAFVAALEQRVAAARA
jgi:hypothetical protein